MEEIDCWRKLSKEEQVKYLAAVISAEALSDVQFPVILVLLGAMAFLTLFIYTEVTIINCLN